MTKFGKAMVFINLFVGVGLFAWAVSLYANRLDYFDRKDAEPPVEGLFTRHKKEVDELSAIAATAQTTYARKAEQARTMDGIREFRLGKLGDSAEFVRKGDDAKIIFRQYVLLRGPLSPEFADLGAAPALIDVKPAVQPAAVKNTRNGELQGLGYLKSRMADAIKEEKDTIARIRQSLKKLEDLSDEANALQVELFAQKRIRDNLGEERQFIGDSQINWDEQLKILERRKKQMEDRLVGLQGGTKVTRADNK